MVDKLDKGMISIIMLSYGDGKYISETVRSVLAQTYQNWELLYVAESNDGTISMMTGLKAEDAKILKDAGIKSPTYSYGDSRIKISYIVGREEETPRRNAALRNAKGKWIAFLDAGDVWEPTKLEHQITFMEKMGMHSHIRNTR